MRNNRVDFKLVLLGKEYGGKTSLLERFVHDKFNDIPYENTIGAAFEIKRMVSNRKAMTFGIWDTAGSERYEAVSKIYYRGAKAAIVCYDMTDKSHFDRVRYWVNELRDTEEECKLYIVGTKLDLVKNEIHPKEVNFDVATNYANEVGAFAIETSSKTGEHVQELFQKIADDFIEDPNTSKLLDDVDEQPMLNLSETSNQNRKRCCKS